MMKVKHNPRFKPEKICEVYSEKDGVDIKYVCTTDLRVSDQPVDVFYRETPHPDFGNRYFGIYYDVYRDASYIVNADIVEEFEFGMVENDSGELEYSESHHDCKTFKNGSMIDGGRNYIRGYGYQVFRVKDGELVNDDV